MYVCIYISDEPSPLRYLGALRPGDTVIQNAADLPVGQAAVTPTVFPLSPPRYLGAHPQADPIDIDTYIYMCVCVYIYISG